MKFSRIANPIEFSRIVLPDVPSEDLIFGDYVGLLTGSLRSAPHSVLARLNTLGDLLEKKVIEGLVITTWSSEEQLYLELIRRSKLSGLTKTIRLVIIDDSLLPEWYRSLHFQQAHILGGTAHISPLARVLRVRTDKFDFTFDMINIGMHRSRNLLDHNKIVLGWKHDDRLSWIPFFQPDGIVCAHYKFFRKLEDLIPNRYISSASPGLFTFMSGGAELGLLGAGFIFDDIFIKAFNLLFELWHEFTANPSLWMNYWSPRRVTISKYLQVFSQIVDSDDFECVAQMLFASWYLDKNLFYSMTDIERPPTHNHEDLPNILCSRFASTPLGSYISKKIDLRQAMDYIDRIM